MQAAARNLGVIMRRLFGIGTPCLLQGINLEDLLAKWCALWRTSANLTTHWLRQDALRRQQKIFADVRSRILATVAG